MTSEQTLADVLANEHLPMRGGTACQCGWSAGLSLNDTRSDQRQHLRHLAAVVTSLLASDDVREVMARALRVEERNASMSFHDWGEWNDAHEEERAAYRSITGEQQAALIEHLTGTTGGGAA